MMRRGLATPKEISQAIGLDAKLVYQWRRRAGFKTHSRRIAHVRMLLEKGHAYVKRMDRSTEDTVADRSGVGAV